MQGTPGPRKIMRLAQDLHMHCYRLHLRFVAYMRPTNQSTLTSALQSKLCRPRQQETIQYIAHSNDHLLVHEQ